MPQPEITIRNTIPYDLRQMAGTMNADSANIALRAGISPLKALWHNYRQSIICKSVFINGNLCAIFGVSGIVFGDTGKPWICLTPETEEYPMRVAFRFRKELDRMMRIFPILNDYIEENNEKAIRFMELMGFKVSKNIIRINNINFRKAEKKA